MKWIVRVALFVLALWVAIDVAILVIAMNA